MVPIWVGLWGGKGRVGHAGSELLIFQGLLGLIGRAIDSLQFVNQLASRLHAEALSPVIPPNLTIVTGESISAER